MKHLCTLLIAFAFTAFASQNINASGGSISTQPTVSTSSGMNPYVKISWEQFECGNVLIQLFNQNGSVAREFANQEFCNGTFREIYKLSGLRSGSYLLRITIGGQVWQRKFVIW